MGAIYNSDKLNSDVPYAALWVRHAEKDKRYQGVEPFYSDCPLSNSGKIDVTTMSIPDEHRWVGVVCSPYLRCYSTAILLSQRLNVPCIVDFEFCRMKPGKSMRLLALADSHVEDAASYSVTNWDVALTHIGSSYRNHIIVTHNSRLASLFKHLEPELHVTKFNLCGRSNQGYAYSAVVVPSGRNC
jgi:phosphohistidine phosphatase SixA